MKILSRIFIVILILTTISSCTTAVQPQEVSPNPPTTITPKPPTNTPDPPTLTPTATYTSTLTATPTATETKMPTSTSTSTSTPTLTPTQTNTPDVRVDPGNNLIIKYLVHQGTGGPVGCGDSLVPVSVGHLLTGDVNEDVKLAINSLFSTGTKYVGNLYNPLFQSKLRATDVKLKKRTGNVTIHLTGSFTKPKDDCDKLLYRAQVWDTVRQFPEVKLATIWLNQYLLGDLLVVGDN